MTKSVPDYIRAIQYTRVTMRGHAVRQRGSAKARPQTEGKGSAQGNGLETGNGRQGRV